MVNRIKCDCRVVRNFFECFYGAATFQIDDFKIDSSLRSNARLLDQRQRAIGTKLDRRSIIVPCKIAEDRFFLFYVKYTYEMRGGTVGLADGFDLPRGGYVPAIWRIYKRWILRFSRHHRIEVDGA